MLRKVSQFCNFSESTFQNLSLFWLRFNLNDALKHSNDVTDLIKALRDSVTKNLCTHFKPPLTSLKK